MLTGMVYLGMGASVITIITVIAYNVGPESVKDKITPIYEYLKN